MKKVNSKFDFLRFRSRHDPRGRAPRALRFENGKVEKKIVSSTSPGPLFRAV